MLAVDRVDYIKMHVWNVILPIHVAFPSHGNLLTAKRIYFLFFYYMIHAGPHACKLLA
jgi:hypothetical protein